MTKTFKLNESGKIEFTKEELDKLLDEVWNDGYNSNTNYVWESPYRWQRWWETPYYYPPTTTTPYVTWTSADALTPSEYTTGSIDAETWTTTFGRKEDKVTPTNE